MEMSNVLIVMVIGAFLYLEGHVFIAQGVVALTLAGTLASKLKRKEKKPKKNPGVEMLDPIEIETIRKPPYRIPKSMDISLSPNKKPSTPQTTKALKASPLGMMGNALGKRIRKKGD